MTEQVRVVSGPTSYPTGGFTVTFGKLRKVKTIKELTVDSGYIAEVADITGNQVKVLVRYFNYPATAAGTATEVPSGTNLGSVTFRIVAEGF